MRCSVALCTYNGERFLSAQLDSIAAQSRAPDELVACDDASTDGTLEILRQFAAHAPFPVRIHQHEATTGVRRNFESAIGRCAGDWIALADQDDVWQVAKLELLEAALAGPPPAAVVFTDADVVDEALQPVGHSLWDALAFGRRRLRMAHSGHLLDVLLWRNVAAGATMAFRTECRDLVLPIPDPWMHDAWIAMIMAAAGRVLALETRTVRYRQHRDNRIGAERPTVPDRVRRVLAAGSGAELPLRLRLLRTASERLERVLEGTARQEALSRIARKTAHLDARARMPAEGWRRLPLVARELAAGNYHRYSSGWLSALTDLAVAPGYRGATASSKV